MTTRRQTATARTARSSAGTGPDGACVGQADRTFIDSPVMLKVAGGGVKGMACDVSERGLKVVVDPPPQLGPVSVKLVGLPAVRGEIRWRTAHRVGVHLFHPFAPDVLADWIKYHGSRGR